MWVEVIDRELSVEIEVIGGGEFIWGRYGVRREEE